MWYRIAIERDPLDSEAQQGLSRVDQGGIEHQRSDNRPDK